MTSPQRHCAGREGFVRRFLPVTLALAFALLVAGWIPQADAHVSWVDATGSWDVPSNWSSDPLRPGPGDDVVINVAGVETITHSTGTDTVNSLTIGNGNNLAVTGGSLTVSGAYSPQRRAAGLSTLSTAVDRCTKWRYCTFRKLGGMRREGLNGQGRSNGRSKRAFGSAE